jgi:hypothetical protein
MPRPRGLLPRCLPFSPRPTIIPGVSSDRPDIVVVTGPGPRWLRLVLAAVAVVYLAALVGGPTKLWGNTPQVPTFRFFSQISCLFPHAARMIIEYRAQAYSCEGGGFAELDTREYFPMHRDNKENRFHRLGFFFRRNARVMTALEEYLVARHNERWRAGEPTRDGVDGPIGGVRTMSLRIPLPPLYPDRAALVRRVADFAGVDLRLPETGELARYQRRPLGDYPRSYRRYWHRPDKQRTLQRCERLLAETAPAARGAP